MEALAAADEEVRMTLGIDQQEKIRAAFPDGSVAELGMGATEEEEPEWLKSLDRDKKGNIYNTSENAKIILKNDRWLRGKFTQDIFAHRRYVLGDLPWRTGGGVFKDVDEAGVRNYLEFAYKLTAAAKIDDALELIFAENSYHPVPGLFKWTGVGRGTARRPVTD